MQREFLVENKWFKKIRNGQKVYEIRLDYPSRQDLKVGNLIRIKNQDSGDFEVAQIEQIQKFDSFKKLFAAIDNLKLGFENNDPNNYLEIEKYYSKEQQKEHKAVAYKIKLVKFNLDEIDNFVFDMDGTLLNEKNDIFKENIATIEKLQQMGKKVIIATGRPYYTLQTTIGNIKPDFPMITSNGAMIYDNQNHHLIHYDSMPSKDAKQMFDKLIELNYEFLIYTTNGMFGHPTGATNFFPERDNYSFLAPGVYTEIDASFDINKYHVCKFLILTDSAESSLIKKIEQLSTSLSGIHGLYSRKTMYDVMENTATKGKGLMYLASKYNLDLNRTIAFGDGENDISMFDVVKYSVSMDNGFEIAKRSAVYPGYDNNSPWIGKLLLFLESK